MASKLYISAIAMCLIMGIACAAYLINASDSGSDRFVCNFENMRGDYVATRRELSREGNTIFVSQGQREFMFSRRFLVLPCAEQIVEQFDE